MSFVKPSPRTFYLWDLPVRVTHWLLVLLVLTSWLTVENGWLEWHRVSGYAILTLILFRFYWGFFGSTPARFAHFLRSPRTVLRTLLRKSGVGAFGHSALGGWSVAAMLAVLFLQVALGLFAVDIDGLESGPLAEHVSFETGRRAAQLHETIFNCLLVLILVHIAAILAYLFFRRENLILPMITGRKQMPYESSLPTYRFPALWQAVIGIALAALVVTALVLGL